MKKIFFLAASLLAGMNMMAAVDFHYLPTAGDKNAAGTEFNTSDKVEVPADEVFITADAFEVRNAFATTYKVVGMMTDTAYNELRIGDVVVDYKTQRIQGQDNPTAGGANPVIDMKCPNAGAAFKVTVKKDGYLYVAVKSTPNKQQFVFEGIAESAGSYSGTMVGCYYLTMSNNTSGSPIGNPDGCIRVEYKGESELNELLAPPAMPYTYLRDDAYSINGIGVLCVAVYADAETYIVGTAGSKMMACGFGFSEELVDVTAIGCQDKEGVQHEDVVLYDADGDNSGIVVADCSKKPIILKAKMPEETASVDAVWNVLKEDGKSGANMSAYVWADGVEGSIRTMSKSGNNYVLQVDDLEKFNVYFLSGTELGANNAKTGDLLDVTADGCYAIGGFDAANADQTCTIFVVDCTTGDVTGLEETAVAAKAQKVISADGQLRLVMEDGTVYNVLGTIVK